MGDDFAKITGAGIAMILALMVSTTVDVGVPGYLVYAIVFLACFVPFLGYSRYGSKNDD